MTRRQSAQVSDRRHLSARERSLAWYPFDIAIDPQIFCFKEIPVQDKSQEQWHQQNLCVHLATHPDNERNMQAAVASLVAEMVKLTDNLRGIIYGVVFSIFHCVVVRIDTQSGFTRCTAILASFHANTPCTPGITAPARLGFHSDVEIVSRVACVRVDRLRVPNPLRPIKPISRMDVVIGHVRSVLKPLGRGRIGQLLPQEIWRQVALELYGLIDLLLLAWFSASCKSAVEHVLRYSSINDHRLVRTLASPDKVYNVGQDTLRDLRSFQTQAVG